MLYLLMIFILNCGKTDDVKKPSKNPISEHNNTKDNVKTSEHSSTGFLEENELFSILKDQDRNYYTNQFKRLIQMPKYIEAYPNIINKLLKAGADINGIDKDGNSLPMLACKQEGFNENFIKLLLDSGADVNHTNNNGVTALMITAESKDIEKLNQLLLAGANKEIMDKKNQKALDYAKPKVTDYEANRKKSEQIIKILEQ